MTANALIRALEQRDVLTEEERGLLRRLPAREIEFGAGDLSSRKARARTSAR